MDARDHRIAGDTGAASALLSARALAGRFLLGPLMNPIRSDLGWSTRERITVRGKDLPGEILGTLNLGDMAYFELTGNVPNEKQSRLFNAMAVTLVEHGVTPSALAARLTYLGAT